MEPEIGKILEGKVTSITKFGAFVEVEKGVDGLVHVSQISHEWLENPTSVLKVGDEVEAKILGIDPEKEKMTLSIKALTPAPERPRREDAEGEAKHDRKGRREKVEANDDEPREWSEGGVTGVSLGDLLNK